jgi:hypothetical protein
VDALGEDARAERRGQELFVTLAAGADIDAFLARTREHGARVGAVTPRYDSLEDLFLRHAQAAPGDHAGATLSAGPESKTGTASENTSKEGVA